MAAKVWFKMVEPESDWTRVSLDGIEYIDDIRAEIRNTMRPKLDQYPAADLAISATKGDEDARNAERLDARDTLESILSRFGIEGRPTIPEAFARNVWLFVSVPTAPQRSTTEGHLDSSATVSSDNRRRARDLKGKCEKLHRLLWKKKHLRDKIFVEKQVSVPQLHLDAASSEVATFTELSLHAVISEFLQQDSGKIPEEWDELLPCRSNSLLFRTAYRELIQCLESYDCEEGGAGNKKRGRRDRLRQGFIITGQPGIGKTWFLSALLVVRLLLGSKTVFQVGFSDVYRHLLFEKSGVHYLDELNYGVDHDTRVWALADRQLRGGLQDLAYHRWLVVLTSSPKSDNYKQFEKECSPPMYFVATWSWGEILAAWSILSSPSSLSFTYRNIFRSPSNINIDHFEKLWDIFNRYGPVPRILIDIFAPAIVGGPDRLRVAMEKYEDKIDLKLRDFLKGSPETFFFLYHSGFDDSHTIILLEPVTPSAPHVPTDQMMLDELDERHDSTSPVNPVASPQFISERFKRRIATPWMGMRLSYLFAELTQAKCKQIFEGLMGNARSATTAGWVFEGLVHRVLSAGGDFGCRGLTANDSLLLHLANRGTRGTTFSNLRELGAMLRSRPRAQTIRREMCGVYLHPTYSNLGAVDSIAITADHNNEPRAVLFQITIARSHPLSAAQLRIVWDALPNEVKKVPPAVVFVVPLKLGPGYKKQGIGGGGTGDGPEGWPQFELGISDERLWEIGG